MLTRTDYSPHIEQAAAIAGLDAGLVEALVLVESGGDPWAYNPEPRYRYFWDVRRHEPFRALSAAEIAAKDPPADFAALAGDRDQEWWGQQASFGLCQLMGAVARERGFMGRYLTQLCDPTINLTIACTHLASLIAWARGREDQALAAYNGGRAANRVEPFAQAAYAAKVLAKRPSVG